MLLGILAGLATGALWGLIFIAPLAVAPYSGVDLAIGRYLAFMAVSVAVLVFWRHARMPGLSLTTVLNGIWLGVLGYSIFYGFLVIAVAHAGVQVSAVVLGLLPIILALAGNVSAGLRWRALALPLVLLALGLLIVNGFALMDAGTPAARGEIVFGIVAALCSVASWVGYGILNARAVATIPNLDTIGWTSLQGVGAGLGILAFGLAAEPFGYVNLIDLGLAWPDAKNLLVWSLLTGVLGGWIATYFWNVASSRLPLVLSGQLYVSEPAFGVVYGFLWEGRWPTVPEAVGIAAVFGGVLVGIAAVGKARRAAQAFSQ